MLTPDRWKTVEQLFHEALALPPSDRSGFVDRHCAIDSELRHELESLLAAEAGPDAGEVLIGEAAAAWASGGDRESLIGREIGGYRVESLLGVGGMGEVYLAEDRELGRKIALKLLPAAFTTDPGRLRRFADEARAASALNHPNILIVYQIGEMSGRRFIATEYIDGETLRDRIARGPLPLGEALDIASQVTRALAAAHDAGIVHRDIKPENIMVRRDGYVKVLDFGLAKLADQASRAPGQPSQTREGAVVGTLDYMAPEQAHGQPVDARADLYSLSVVLYEMVTGVLPRELGSSSDHAASSARAVPPALLRVLQRGVASDPAKRHQTAGDLQRDLNAIQQRTTGGSWRTGALRWAAAAGVLIAIAVLFAIGLTVRLGTPVVPAAAPVRSLAVLPFDALVAGADTEHLQVGMADALTTRLAAVTELRVPSTAAVRRYARGPDVDIQAIARQLNVDAVLTGGVQRAGDQIRVTVQVTRATDGAQIWASRFDSPFTGIFALQDEIAEQIAAKLVTGLTDRERASLRPRETSDPEAYELYLQGRQLWERRTPETIRTAIATLTRATERDPNFARAHAWLANAYAITASGLRPTERFPVAKAEALKAVQLDDRLADAHTALAFLAYKSDWNWVLAEREFKRAVELDPTFVLARHWYGEFLALLDRPDEALEQYRVARELDPQSVPLRADQASVLIRAGQAEVALQLIDEGLRGDPLEWRLYNGRVAALNALGRGQEALEDELKQRQFSGASAEDIVALREAYRKAGSVGLKQQRIVLLKRQLQVGRPLPFGVASALAAAYGDVSDAGATLEWLERATDLNEDAPLFMKVMPQYAFLRSDARFQALMHRVGLDTGRPVQR